jgi:hypothetical protein
MWMMLHILLAQKLEAFGKLHQWIVEDQMGYECYQNDGGSFRIKKDAVENDVLEAIESDEDDLHSALHHFETH